MTELDKTNQNQKEEPDLYRRTIKGGGIVFFSQFIQQLLNIARIVILARLLSPRDFGILAIAMLARTFLEIFTQTGIDQALIQTKEKISNCLNTAWTIQFFRSLLLFLVLFICAPFIVAFFDSSGDFSDKDIQNPKAIIAAVEKQENELTGYLYRHFDNINEYATLTQQETELSNEQLWKLRSWLKDQFNHVLTNTDLYTSERFEHIPLTPFAQRVVNEQYTQENIKRVNRLLLEESFSGHIRPVILNRRQLRVIIQLLALTLLFTGIRSIKVVLLKKELHFSKLFGLNFTTSLVQVCATIILAFIFRNVWALIWGILIGNLVRCVLGYILCPYRPTFEFQKPIATKLWKFGRHIAGLNILSFLNNEADDFFVGKFLGPAPLGYYRYAYYLSSLPSKEISNVVNNATLPSFSKIQTNLEKLRQAYIKSTIAVALLSFLAIGLIFALAYEITLTFLGENWLGIVCSMKILCFLGLIKALFSGNVFIALGKPHLILLGSIFRFLIMCVLIYPFSRAMGIEGTSLAVVISCVAIVPWLLYHIKQLIGHSMMEFLVLIATPLFSSILMIAGITVLKSAIPFTSYISLLLYLVSGTIIYCVMILVLSYVFRNPIALTVIKEIFKAYQRKGKTNESV